MSWYPVGVYSRFSDISIDYAERALTVYYLANVDYDVYALDGQIWSCTEEYIARLKAKELNDALPIYKVGDIVAIDCSKLTNLGRVVSIIGIGDWVEYEVIDDVFDFGNSKGTIRKLYRGDPNLRFATEEEIKKLEQ